MKQEGS